MDPLPIAYLIFLAIGMFVPVLGQDILVTDAECCLSIGSPQAVTKVRCPSQSMQTQCASLGCCVFSNQTSSDVQIAEQYTSYGCFGSDVSIGPWQLCDAVQDCPYADDEFYCDSYYCVSVTVSLGDVPQISLPCPLAGECYIINRTDSCQGLQRCANSLEYEYSDYGSSVIDEIEFAQDTCGNETCPSTCVCDVLSMYCVENIVPSLQPQEQSYSESQLDGSLLGRDLKVFALVKSLGSVVITTSSQTVSDEDSNILLNPSEMPRITLLGIFPAADDESARLDLTIEDSAFTSNPHLKDLVIERTTLSIITNQTFEGLTNLNYLDLDENDITDIADGAFKDLKLLEYLDIEFNWITYIRSGAFIGLGRLKSLALGGNGISMIAPGAFLPLIQLRFLFLTEVDLDDLPVEIFDGLQGLQAFHVDDFRLCCRVSELGQCVNYEPARFSTCSGGLLHYRALGVFMWILGFSALLGNAFVLITRHRLRSRGREKLEIQAILIMNLAAADILTGVYMVFLASADTAFGQEYFVYATDWREGPWCKVIGFIALLSSEASVLTLSLISLDRFLNIVFPFSSLHLTTKSVRISVAVIWIISIVISMVPQIVLTIYPDNANFYLISDVCLGLPLIRSTTVEFMITDYDYDTGNLLFTHVNNPDNNYPFYAIVIFIGLNLLCFLVIVGSYLAIFVSARRSSRKSTRLTERDRELQLAMRMALIVGTDFCCWMPIIIMGILAQTGLIQIPEQLYAWCVVFILPINSAVNPHLYTFATRQSREQRKGQSSSSGLGSRPTHSSDVPVLDTHS